MEENSGEEGLLAEVIESEKQKITAKARLKEIGKDLDYADERKMLQDYSALLDKQTGIKAKLKTAQDDLEAKLKPSTLGCLRIETKPLVVGDKWLVTLVAAVQGDLDRISQTLTGRIRQLAERYATPLPTLTKDLATFSARVDEHLKKMGAVARRPFLKSSGTKWGTDERDYLPVTNQ